MGGIENGPHKVKIKWAVLCLKGRFAASGIGTAWHLREPRGSCCILTTPTWFTSLSPVSVQFSRSVVSNCLQPPWTAAHQASMPITNSQSLLKLMSIESVVSSIHSSSVAPFSSCLQSFLTSGSFPVNKLFVSGGQSIRVSASASVFLINIQD